MRVLGKEGDRIIVNEYPKDGIRKIKRLRKQGKAIDAFGAFDIETSLLEYKGEMHGLMYLWQFAVGKIGEEIDVYIGRTWKDYINFLEELRILYSLNINNRMVIYVHNLGYEFQFLRSVQSVTRMFAVEKRVPVVAIMDECFEYRCSYKLSNMSLDKFAKQENARHLKIGQFDYSKKRYQDTILNDYDLLYGVCDVLALHESMSNIMLNGGDNLSTIPYTSTGFVRRESRERVQANRNNYYSFIDSRLTSHQYKLCKSSVRGGDTHANALYVNSILENVRSKDKASSYPHQMLTKKYPYGKMMQDTSGKLVRDASNIMFVELRDVRLKDGYYMPYIPISRCERLNGVSYKGCRFDNGRVLSAPLLYMCINDIDYEIIIREYDCNITILENWVSGYEYLNKDYRDFVYQMFVEKCKLKGKDEYYYNKYKNKINALFGMMLTDITREEITYIDGDWSAELPDTIKALNAYYSNRKSFLSYQHGLYVTAHARAALREAINALGSDIIYVDTDSTKYINEHDSIFEKINNEIRRENELVGVKPVIVNDKKYELGVWEDDGNYKYFATQGAKKYAQEYEDGHIVVTVAGLNKKKGSEYLMNHGGMEAFLIPEGETEGLLFRETDSGRMTAKYHDEICLEVIIVDGHKMELTSNIALVPTTYQLGRTEEYMNLVEMHSLIC